MRDIGKIFTEAQLKAMQILSECKQTLLFGGSRSGKTFLIIFAIVARAVSVGLSRHGIFRQTRKDLKESIWLDTFPKVLNCCFPEWKPKLNNSDLMAKFSNGSEIWFGFLDETKPDNVLGKEYNTIFLNEISEISYSSYSKALSRLALKNQLNNKLYADCNPPGKWHWGYKVFIDKKNPKDNIPLIKPETYGTMLMNPKDNLKNLPEDYLEILENLPEDEKNRFLLGIWQEGISGGIYTREIGLAEQEGRIGNVPFNSDFYVHTFWDIGIDDSTAITFAQFIGDEIHLIDYYCNNNLPASHYMDILEQKARDKGYQYGILYLPHDGKQREWLTGKTRQEVMQQRGFNVRVMPATSIVDGINTAKETFKNVWIDKINCEELLLALSNYHRKEDTKNLVYSKEPVHDWTSHGADTFRLLCVANCEITKENRFAKGKAEQYKKSIEYMNTQKNYGYKKSSWG